jgi:hypothetical protein
VTGKTVLGIASSTALSISGDSFVTGTTTLATTTVTQLAATGQTTLATASSTGLTSSGTLNVTGKTVLGIASTSILTATDLFASGNTLFAGTLGVTGKTTLTTASTTILTSTGLFSSGNLNVAGQTTLGTASSTDLTLTGSFYDSVLTRGGNGQVLLSTGTSTLWTNTSSLGFVSNTYATATFPTFIYSSSTFPTFTYATATFPTFTYASSTFAPISTTVTNTYASSTFPSFTYATSTYVAVIGNQTVAGDKTFSGTSTLATTTVTKLTATGQSTLATASTTGLTSSGTLNVTGQTILGNASTTGLTSSGTLNVTGQTVLGNASSSASSVSGNFFVTGTSTLATTTLALTSLIGDILPTTDISRSLGSNTFRFLNLFAQNIFATSSVITSGTSTNYFATNYFGTNGTFNTALTSNGTLNVTGQSTLATASTTGLTSSGTLNVTGQTILGNASTTGLTSSGTLNVTGKTVLGIASSTALSISGDSFVTGTTTLATTTVTQLAATGQTTLATASSTGLTSSGTLNVTGQTVLGNASTTALTAPSLYSTLAKIASASTTNLTLFGNLYDSVQSSGALGQVLLSTGTSTIWVATSSLGITGGGSGVTGGVNGFVARFTGPTSVSSGLLIDDGTVSGVNATSSSYTFNVQASGATNPFNVASSSGASFFNIDTVGKLTFGNASSSALTATSLYGTDAVLGGTLNVTGQTILGNASTTGLTSSGTLNVTGKTTLGNASTSILTATDLFASGNLAITGTTNLTGKLTATTASTTILTSTGLFSSGNLNVASNAIIGGTLDVTGKTTITTASTTDLTTTGYHVVTGTSTLATTTVTKLDVTGQTTLATASTTGLTSSGTLNVTGQTILGNASTTGLTSSGTLNVTGKTVLGIASTSILTATDLFASGNTLFAGTLGVTGKTTLTTASTTILTSTGLFSSGNLNVAGQTTLGTASSTDLTLTGSFYDSVLTRGGNGQVLLSTGTSTLWTNTSSLGFVSNTYATATFPTFIYSSSTFPTFTYATATFPTFTYASSTFAPISTTVTNTYASSTFPSFTYATSTYVAVIGNQTVAGDKTFSGTSTLATTTVTKLTATGQSTLATASTTGLTSSGTLNVTGQTILGNASTTGLTSSGTLNVTGQTVLGNASSSASSVSGNFFVTGTSTLATTTLALTSLIGDILPTTDISRSLGSNTFRFLNLFAQNIFATSSVITSGTSTNYFATNYFGTNGTFNTALTSNGTLNVTGQSTLATASTTGLTSSGTLNVTGQTILGNASTTGLTSSGTLNVTGKTVLGIASSTALSISGDSFVTGTTTLATTTVTQLAATGQTTLGNASSSVFTATTFFGAGTGLTGTASGLTAGLITSQGTLATLNAAPAGTLTGTILNATVVSSSLTSVGTLASLAVSGQTTLGSASSTGLTLGTGSSVTGRLFFANASNNFTTQLIASSTIASNLTFTLPGTAGSPGNTLLSDGSGGMYWGAGAAATLTGGTTGFVTRWTSATSVGTGLLIDDGTVSGVNATSSSYTFNVQASGATNPFNVASSSGASFFNIDTVGKLTFGNASSTGLTLSGTLNVTGQTVLGNASTTGLTSSGTLNVTGKTTITTASTTDLTTTGYHVVTGTSTLATTTVTQLTATGQSSLTTASSTSQTISSILYTPVITGTTAGLTIVNTTGSSNAFQVQNSSSADVLNINTNTLQNLISNPSMESNINGWAAKGSSVVVYDTTAGNAQFGSATLQATTTAATTDGVKYNVPLKPSQTYVFTVYAKVGTGSVTAILGRDENGASVETSCGGFTITTAWQQFTCSFTTGATQNATSSVYLRQTASAINNIYIDGAVLVTGTTALTYDAGGTNINVQSLSSAIAINNTNTGELQPWQLNANALPANREDAATIISNGFIYEIGGFDGTNRQNSVYYAKMNADGSVAAWSTMATGILSNAVAQNRQYPGATVANGYMYVIGGFDGTQANSSVFYSKLNSDGTTGTWYCQGTITAAGCGTGGLPVNSNGLPAAKVAPSVVVSGGFIYVLGGCTDSAATCATPSTVNYYARLRADGSTGPWTSTGALSSARGMGSAVFANGNIYFLGGRNSTGTTVVDKSAIASDGSLAAFSTTNMNPLLANRQEHAAVIANGYLYVVGGSDGAASPARQSTVYYAKLNGDGTLGKWQTATNALPAGRSAQSTVVANGYIYVIGGCALQTAGACSTNQTSSVMYASGARTLVGGTLDLVGLTSQSLADFGGAGAITAGNGRFIGDLKVDGFADFNNGLSVDSAINLNAVSADPGQTIFNINNSSSNSIFSVQHMNTTFGSLANAGAFVQTLSYLGEEFNGDFQNTATTTNATIGDDRLFNFRTGAIANTYSNPRTINGVGRVILGATTATGALISYGTLTTAGAAINATLKTSNLPVMQMKFIPVQSGNALIATADYFIGMMDATTTQTLNDTLPANGVFLWTNNSVPATGGTLALQGVVRTNNATVGSSVTCSGAYTFGNSITARIQVESATTARFLIDFNASDGINFVDCGIVTGTFPTAQLSPEFYGIHTDTTVRQFDIDYMRVWQDDAPESGTDSGLAIEDNSTTTLDLSEEAITEVATTTKPVFNAKNILADLMTGLDPEVMQDKEIERLDTGRMVAGVEIVTPKLTADTVITRDLVLNDVSLSDLLDTLTASSTAANVRISALEHTVQDYSSFFSGGLVLNSIGTATTSLDILGDVTFFGRPYFTSDTGGSAVIKAGARSVDIVFDREYIEQPIVGATIAFTASTTDEEIEGLFADGVQFVITKRSSQGFTILLNKKVSQDITFNWNAFAIKDSKEFTSRSLPSSDSQTLPQEPESPSQATDSSQISTGENASSSPSEPLASDDTSVDATSTDPQEGEVAGTSTENIPPLPESDSLESTSSSTPGSTTL